MTKSLITHFWLENTFIPFTFMSIKWLKIKPCISHGSCLLNHSQNALPFNLFASAATKTRTGRNFMCSLPQILMSKGKF